MSVKYDDKMLNWMSGVMSDLDQSELAKQTKSLINVIRHYPGTDTSLKSLVRKLFGVMDCNTLHSLLSLLINMKVIVQSKQGYELGKEMYSLLGDYKVQRHS